MSTKFFTNSQERNLFDKFKGVLDKMKDLHSFHAVVGYFRSSGYFALQPYLKNVKDVKILVGINVDQMFAESQRSGLIYFGDENKTKEEFLKWFIQDIKEAKYSAEVEDGVLQFINDLIDGKIEVRAHNSAAIHAKFYLFLPEEHSEHSDGWVIMGSSNLTEAGLGIKKSPNYELNIALKDYDDVEFTKNEFKALWEQSTSILPADILQFKQKTHIGQEFSPYELYVKFLIEFFGKNIEYDPDSISDIPLKKFKKLSYQIDAVNQGYELLLKHNGFFLADVVGTGKTVMAALLAKKFYLTNGPKTRILVVYPPALEKNWTSTFKDFEIQNYCDFITNGSLDKIINGKFKNDKERYDLILVDEAHKFRNHKSQQFQNLQIICKSGREFIGGVAGFEKKVVLISATPLNNKPDDIYRLLTLFQDERNCNLPSVPENNLQKYFYPHTQKYKEEISQNPINLASIQEIFNDIRDKVIKDITIRRTRTDLQKNERYCKDLLDQKIYFPKVVEPFTNEYLLPKDFAELFLETFNTIIDKNKIDFYRYQAIAYLTDEANNGTYQNAETISKSLASIMHNQLIKRLESSFYAFKKSLQKITTSTAYMIEMYENNKVYIAPDTSISITDMMDKAYTDEEIEFEMERKNDAFNPRNRTFEQKDFDKELNDKDGKVRPKFIDGLKKDFEYLTALNTRWQAIEENNDPKWDVFVVLLKTEYFNTNKNELGKLVIFTESVDTLTYLKNRLNNETSYKVLSITAENRNRDFEIIRENFDANYEKAFKNDYDIILTTDVLAEGINLHRANVIVNYDTPWNPTKLIQRLGRINRIGSKANFIYNYNFYPSEQGDDRINLKNRSLGKLQGSHSAYGEDNKIYSLQEIIEQWGMFDPDKKDDDTDIRGIYLEFLRKFKEQNPEYFKAIQKMPLKIRCIRQLSMVNDKLLIKNNDGNQLTINNSPLSISYVKNGEFKNIYLHSQGKSYSLPFEKAVQLFETTITEEGILPIPELHYKQINHIVEQFERDITKPETIGGREDIDDIRANSAIKHLNNWLAAILVTEEGKESAVHLLPLIKNGTYANLTNEVYKMRNEADADKIEREIIKLAQKYTTKIKRQYKKELDPVEPKIIISETFI